MKRYIIQLISLLAIMLSMGYGALAQVKTDTNINLQPLWGPAGYTEADYYYLPDVECYYSVSSHQFIYLANGRWVYAAVLPVQFKNYDLYSGYKIVINSARPFLNFAQDKILYVKFKRQKGKQPTLKDARIKPDSDNAGKKGTGADYGP
jgi:hypothetical protein